MKSSIDFMVSTSLQLAIVDPKTIEPKEFGSGCIVKYRNQLFLISVAHVTNHDGLSTCIVTHQRPVNSETPLYSVGRMNYFDEYTVSKTELLDEVRSMDDLLKDFKGTIDFTFCKIKESLELIQPELNLGFHTVEKGEKLMIDLDYTGNPVKDKHYGLCGNIGHKKRGNKIESKISLKLDLKYHATKGRFHKFIAPQIITHKDEYKGCSGAPIIGNDGRMVALAVKVGTGSKIVLGFSMDECKRLLDIAIDTGMV
jgi:hypothetical protein